MSAKQNWQENTATDKQLDFLKKIHPGPIPDNLTKGAAKEMIEAALEEQDKGQTVRPRQLAFIDDLWGKKYSQMTAHQASLYIEYLLSNQPNPIIKDEGPTDGTNAQ